MKRLLTTLPFILLLFQFQNCSKVDPGELGTAGGSGITPAGTAGGTPGGDVGTPGTDTAGGTPGGGTPGGGTPGGATGGGTTPTAFHTPYKVDGTPKLDLLVISDNSGSMLQKQPNPVLLRQIPFHTLNTHFRRVRGKFRGVPQTCHP